MHDRRVIASKLASTRTGIAGAIRIFDHAWIAEPLLERSRSGAKAASVEAGIQIEDISKPYTCKEDVVAKVLAARGDHAGLVRVISRWKHASATGKHRSRRLPWVQGEKELTNRSKGLRRI